MLERFKVPKEDEVKVPAAALRSTVEALFMKMGVAGEDAREGANTLVMTDLRGVETHGVSNMLRAYISNYQQGTLNPRPNWRVLHESPSGVSVDADRGLGVMVAPKVMRMVIDKARETGVGAASMHNSGHTGAVGHHSMLAAEADMIGVCMTAGGPAIPPTFGAEPRFGTNPISIAAPASKEPFFLFDAATSTIAGNKVRLAQRVEADLLPGWIAGPDGLPKTAPTPASDLGEYFLLPLGGTREHGSHKGYGFAMMSEILARLLGGSPSAMTAPESRGSSGTFFSAYNIAAFTDLDAFKKNMDLMLETLRTTKPAPGYDRVLYPGLSEHEETQERLANGIPLHREVIDWFDDITAELSLPRLERVTHDS
jgi:LDH2 family malate/lactate/ureidoglycolate dehydrogenase